MVGSIISHYRVLEELGRGGMGVVYKAQDTKLDRTVALKFLPSHLSASETDKARFTQEAKAASALNHPNICTIYSIDEHEGQLFIAMEFVDGQTLQERKPSLSSKQAIDIGIQVAEGLAAAHEKGIVHRDIKPENIMVRKDGIVQIMDFGLAKLRNASSQVNRLTKEGSTVGTAGYMSPEQIQGMEADHRSDIFSFGILLYEMLTGQLPFKGVHETALAYEIVNVDAAPMSSIKPDIDPSLDAIVLECLEKDVNERAQSMKQVAVDLKRYKRESSRQRVSRVTAARPVRQDSADLTASPSATAQAIGRTTGVQESVSLPDRKKLAPILAAFGFLLSFVFLVLWSPWDDATKHTGRISRSVIELPEGYELNLNWNDSPVDISPDGKMIAYSALSRDSGNVRLFVRSLDSYTSKPVADVRSREIKFSPDGRWIYYSDNGSLYKVSIDGGAPVRIFFGAYNPRGIAWGPNGSIYMAAGQVGGVLKILPDRDSVEQVTTPDLKRGEISHRFPSLLPDGNAMLLTVKYTTTASFDDANIVVHDLKTGTNTTIIEGGVNASYVPTGHIIYVRGGSFYLAPFDPDSRRLTGPTRKLFPGGMLLTESGAASYAFSDNGILVYAPGGPAPSKSFTVDWLSLDGRTTPLITAAASYGDLTLSPDRSKLALVVNAANNDVWTYDIQRSTMQRLTFGGGNHSVPIWTTDGKRVAYSAERSGEIEIYWRPWNGSGKEEKLLGEKGIKLFNCGFSPDGKTLLYQRVENNKSDIWAVSMDSTGKRWPVLETPFDEFNVDVSPDGRWLAYHSDESGKPELYVVPFPYGEGRWQITSGGAWNHYWNRGGSEIIYVDDNIRLFAVPLGNGTSLQPGRPRMIADYFKLRFDESAAAFDPVAMRFVCAREIPGLRAPVAINMVTNWFDEVRAEKTEGQ